MSEGKGRASEPAADAETFLAATDTIAALRPELSLLEAGILAGLHLGLAADSRSFARIFGVELPLCCARWRRSPATPC